MSVSPKLSTQPQRVPGVLTHGLAVLASQGGGAEQVGDAEALAALRQGQPYKASLAQLWRDFLSANAASRGLPRP